MALIKIQLYKAKSTTGYDLLSTVDQEPGSYSFTGLTTTQLPVNTVCGVMIQTTDSYGNMENSTVSTFVNGNSSLYVFKPISVIDDTETVSGTYPLVANGSAFPIINDLNPVINITMGIPNISIGGNSSAAINTSCIKSVQILMAWCPYVAGVYNQATIVSKTSSNDNISASTGQINFPATVGATIPNTSITYSGTPSVTLIEGRVYTFGTLWQDINDVYHTYQAADQKSFILDKNPPNTTIANPIDGYIYNGNITTVSGTCADPIIG